MKRGSGFVRAGCQSQVGLRRWRPDAGDVRSLVLRRARPGV